MRFTTRELVTVAVFGALWGALEISLGSVLKALHLPLSGALLATAGVTIALIGRFFVPRPGATLFVGVVATILKLFSIGGVVVGPMIGILAEALLAEVVLTAFGRPRRAAFLLAAALGVVWTVLQPFVTGALLFGRDTVEVWLDLVNLATRTLGLPDTISLLAAGTLVLLHLALGTAAGWLAWAAGQQLTARLTAMPILQN
jgi:ABC-type thiamin/hydroxymethylpyrimidine transport system permease subunit